MTGVCQVLSFFCDPQTLSNITISDTVGGIPPSWLGSVKCHHSFATHKPCQTLQFQALLGAVSYTPPHVAKDSLYSEDSSWTPCRLLVDFIYSGELLGDSLGTPCGLFVYSLYIPYILGTPWGLLGDYGKRWWGLHQESIMSLHRVYEDSILSMHQLSFRTRFILH